MAEISPLAQKLIQKYKEVYSEKERKKTSGFIHVDEVASKVAMFYEYIRTVVEWKEEHLMRRTAIIRKLKRKFLELELTGASNLQVAAESLVLELIRGGHFPNDRIPEKKIKDVQAILEKYIFILKNNQAYQQGKRGYLTFYNWLIEVAACEIEETLSSFHKEMALIEFMFESMKQKIQISEEIYKRNLLDAEEAKIQIFIAVCRALFKLDKPIIGYHLLKQKYPFWLQPNSEQLERIAKTIFTQWEEIEKSFIHPLGNKFYTVCEKYDTPYLLLGDILAEKNPFEIEKKISNPSQLEELIKGAYFKRLNSLKSKIFRAAIYSTISIFITKILFLLLIEILIEGFMAKKVNPIIITGDILIPTLLMFAIVSAVKPPSKKNLSLIIIETMKIVYQKQSPEIYEIKLKKPRSIWLNLLLSLIYSLSAFLSISAIYYLLSYLGFPIFSIIIDIIFIALILFTGTMVAKKMEELTIEEEKENFFTFLLDIFFLPLQGLGRWLADNWKKYNLIAAFFNALIDMPFSAFVEFLERWREFLKERKEELR